MILPLALALLIPAQTFDPVSELSKYDVVWNAPSHDASGSMPIGNGRFGANVWVEEGGDLCLLLSHTDAWSESGRIIKLGLVRVSITPNPFARGEPFTQRLDLAARAIRIGAADTTITVDFPTGADLLSIAGDGAGREVRVKYENWRTSERDLCADKNEGKSSWLMHSAPAGVTAIESADAPIDAPGALVWRHRNAHSVVPFTLEHQGLAPIAHLFPDPYLNRVSGVRITSPALKKVDASTLAGTARGFEFTIAASCTQAQTDEQWLATLPTPAGRTPWRDPAIGDSYIFVANDPAAAPPPVNKHPLRIGVDSGGGNRIDADLRRVAIWNRALDGAAVRKLSEIAREVKDHPSNVIAAWSADRGDATTLTDAGEGAHHMRCIGTLPPLAQERAITLGKGHFETASDPQLDLTSDRTIEVLVRPRSGGRLLDKLTAGTSDGFLFDIHDGRARLITGGDTLHATSPVPMNEWVHLCAVIGVKSGERAIYMNGELIAAAPGADTPSMVTRAYVLSTYMTRCASAGEFPIKFNGSIFTVEPRFTNGAPYNADWRAWGGEFWWQNTRLPYEPMLARAEWNGMDSLFRTYERVTPASVARAKLYYGAEGVYFPETMSSFGTYSNGDYGWDRTNAKIGDIHCPWWQWAWQQGLELTDLMLRRAAYSQDREFLEKRALPMARETLRYFDSRFARDEHGALLITPTQAVETFWEGVVNDMPTVAGLHSVLARLRALPADVGSAEDRALWDRVHAALPPIPLRTVDGVTLLAPAAKYVDKQSNVENPELYAVHPFGIYGVGRPGLEIARESYRRRSHKSTVGWTQDGMVAAMLGLTEEAAANIVARSRNSHRNFRFPAMWGPNFDWLPDQCHNGNITNVLQLMALQCVGEKIYVLPAWPKEWDVAFKLRAEGNTIVECEYRAGKIARLVVTPESRRADVVMGIEQDR